MGDLSKDSLQGFSLRDRVALITGASSGLGRATAHLFASAGADVVLAARSKDGLEETARGVGERGGRSLVVPTDVTVEADVQAMAERALDGFGRVDVLVNNAGGGGAWRRMLEMSLEEWDDIIRLNLTSAFLCARALVPSMLERGSGAIVNVGSISGRRGQKTKAHYGAAKAGLSNLTKTMAVEWAPGIRANAIAAGTIATEKNLAAFPSTEERERWERRVLLRRFGTPEEVAYTALYLASDAGGWMTGQTLDLNGGEWLAG